MTNKIFSFAIMFALGTQMVSAQDDMYFTKKELKPEPPAPPAWMSAPQCSRTDEDYNRGGDFMELRTRYTKVPGDSLHGDTIASVTDTLYWNGMDDIDFARRMEQKRYDDIANVNVYYFDDWTSPWYPHGMYGYYGWHSPWYYDPWFDPYYDPYYYRPYWWYDWGWFSHGWYDRYYSWYDYAWNYPNHPVNPGHGSSGHPTRPSYKPTGRGDYTRTIGTTTQRSFAGGRGFGSSGPVGARRSSGSYGGSGARSSSSWSSGSSSSGSHAGGGFGSGARSYSGSSSSGYSGSSSSYSGGSSSGYSGNHSGGSYGSGARSGSSSYSSGSSSSGSYRSSGSSSSSSSYRSSSSSSSSSNHAGGSFGGGGGGGGSRGGGGFGRR